MRSFRAIILSVCVLLAVTIALDAQTRPRRADAPVPGAPPAPPPLPVPGSPPRPDFKVSSVRPSEPTRFQVELFQVNCPVENLSKINVEQLEKSKQSAAEIIKSLSEVGEAGLPVRISNVIDLSVESRLTEGTRMPTVQDISINSSGKVTPSVTYNEVGANLRVQGNWEGEGSEPSAHVHCQIELSSIGKTGIKLASGVQLPEFRQFKIDQEMLLRDGVPVVLLSNSQPSPPYVSPESDSQTAGPSPRCTVTLVRITAWKLGSSKSQS